MRWFRQKEIDNEKSKVTEKFLLTKRYYFFMIFRLSPADFNKLIFKAH